MEALGLTDSAVLGHPGEEGHYLLPHSFPFPSPFFLVFNFFFFFWTGFNSIWQVGLTLSLPLQPELQGLHLQACAATGPA